LIKSDKDIFIVTKKIKKFNSKNQKNYSSKNTEKNVSQFPQKY